MRWIAAGLLLGLATPAFASDYVAIELHADLAVSADAAWSKIGPYCAIEQFAKLPCKLTSGSGEVGSVRSLAGGMIEEPMVAQTRHSYTYGQTVGPNKGLDYHGTVAVEPAGAGASRLTYTLLYDAALVPADKRAAMRTQLPVRFQGFVDAMKAMAEAR